MMLYMSDEYDQSIQNEPSGINKATKRYNSGLDSSFDA